LSWQHLADNPAAPVFVRYWSNSGHCLALALNGSVANDPQDQGASKPFDFITDNDVGDVINDAKAFAAWI
jgi:hypothetical protein